MGSPDVGRISVYWDEAGNVLLPTEVKTEAGFWLSIEPVEIATLKQPDTVFRAIRNATSRAGKIVPTPTRQNFPKPVILSYAKAKSWREFQRRHSLVALSQTVDKRFVVEQWERVNDGSYIPSNENVLDANTTLDDAISTLIAVMKELG
jgi:hypothetical protein